MTAPRTFKRAIANIAMALFLSPLFLAPEQALGDPPSTSSITIDRILVRESGGKLSALYGRIENSYESAVKLVRVTTPASEKVEIHTSNIDPETGVMQMREIPELEIEPNEVAVLQPRGLHIMLIGLTSELEAEKTIPVTFHFDNQELVTTKAKIVTMRHDIEAEVTAK